MKIENECNENKKIDRIVGSPEDIQCIYNYETKKNNQNQDIPVTVTPTRHSRTNKRNYDMLAQKEAQKMTCVEENIINNLKSLWAFFPKISSGWEMDLADNFIILRRKSLATNKLHADFQQMLMCEDANTKFLNINASTPYQVI